MTPTQIHTQFHVYQQSRERQYSPMILTVLNAQVSQFVHYRAKGMSESDALIMISPAGMYKMVRAIRIDGATIYGAKVRAYLPKYKKPAPRSAFKTLNFKSRPVIGFNERMIALIDAYFDSEILNDAEGITDTTRDEIRRVLKEANENGHGITWMVKKMEDLNSSRAKLIARTETVTGANSGGFLAALDTGLMMQKEWLATNDDRTRHDHAAVSGKTVGITDYFQVGDNTMLYPGDRVQANGLATTADEVCNCRCTVLYKPVRVDGKLVPFDYSQFRALVA